MKFRQINKWILLISCLVIFQNCAPVFSELQSARTVGIDNIEITPSYSTVSVSDDGETDGVQNQIGLQMAYGITPNIDIRARYERVWAKGGNFGDGVSVVGIGPKFSAIENILAFYMPVGRAFGEDTDETWQLHPTVLFTQPILVDKIDATLSSKYLITFCEDCDDLLAFNFGLTIGNDISKWAIRPEYGLLFNPGESGNFSQFSIGFTAILGMQKAGDN